MQTSNLYLTIGLVQVQKDCATGLTVESKKFSWEARNSVENHTLSIFKMMTSLCEKLKDPSHLYVGQKAQMSNRE